MSSRTSISERILIVAPTGADAANICSVFRRAKLHARICVSVGEAAAKLNESGTLLVTEEALRAEHRAVLASALEQQPPWSDLPLLIITSAGSIRAWATESPRLLGARSNVSLVARPLES